MDGWSEGEDKILRNGVYVPSILNAGDKASKESAVLFMHAGILVALSEALRGPFRKTYL